MTELTPELLLQAYANGYFPMAMAHDDPELYWFSPEERGVLPLEGFHIPRGLRRALKTHPYRLTVDRDFEGVMRGCAEITGKADRDETWINEEIVALYCALHRMGHAHSVELWDCSSPHRGEVRKGADAVQGALDIAPVSNNEILLCGSPPPLERDIESRSSPPMGGGVLVGGLYGVSIGGAFFGESMFSRVADASKIALVTLVELLREAGYQLLDTQYVNDHLKQFGVQAMPKADYAMKLEKALSASPNPSTRFSTVSVRRGLASSSSVSSTSAS